MRVSTNMMTGGQAAYMESTLSHYMELIEKQSTQKNINRPSDDPTGTANILENREYLALLNQYEKNTNTALSWLSLADEVLVSASEALISLKEKASQGATETYTQDQRDAIALELRELQEQLVAFSNTEITGDSIFAGHKTDGNAYKNTVAGSALGGGLDDDSIVSTTGSIKTTIGVRFTEAGDIGGAADIDYEYTSDGGRTWQKGTLAAGETELDLGTAKVNLAAGEKVTVFTDTENYALMVRPATIYMGDDNDNIRVDTMSGTTLDMEATGNFSQNITVRIDADSVHPNPASYSYSLDGGDNWITGHMGEDGQIDIPGGFLKFSGTGGLTAGDQFVVVPNTANKDINISAGQSITMNNVGKEIFGGLNPDGSDTLPDEPDSNLFETIGELIGYMELGHTNGIKESLDKIDASHRRLTSGAADVGSRENRASFTQSNIDMQVDYTTGSISQIEDVKLEKLLIDLAAAEMTYNAVLSSTSKILQLSIMNYL